MESSRRRDPSTAVFTVGRHTAQRRAFDLERSEAELERTMQRGAAVAGAPDILASRLHRKEKHSAGHCHSLHWTSMSQKVSGSRIADACPLISATDLVRGAHTRTEPIWNVAPPLNVAVIRKHGMEKHRPL